jgi:hypothetical protein
MMDDVYQETVGGVSIRRLTELFKGAAADYRESRGLATGSGLRRELDSSGA